jgi:CRP-like cAMP-binding protein
MFGTAHTKNRHLNRLDRLTFHEFSASRIIMEDSLPPTLNHLLAALPAEAQQKIFPHLKLVEFKLGQTIYEAGDSLANVHFPLDSIVSLLYVMEDGNSAEISIVGNDGLVGIAVFMSGKSTPGRAIVQAEGHAYQLSSPLLLEIFEQDHSVRVCMLRYTQALITQMAQTAVCNRHHTVDQQLCRWILLSLDRLPTNELNMTQGLIANMLGVRREGVTESAGKLQKIGAIKYQRGLITVLDRSILENQCCECYAVVKRETDRLLNFDIPANKGVGSHK